MISSNYHALSPNSVHHRGGGCRLPLPSPIFLSLVPPLSSPKRPSEPTMMRLQGRAQSHSIPAKKPQTVVPARDRLVGFGKYRGKMLGTLPSTYLRWISDNLRAGDSEEWSKLADEVLEDPVYRDRIEWEFAEGVLTGNSAASSRTEGAVSELLEISERFGWDNEDKLGWSRVDFELLGTSKGGRIPRKAVLDTSRDAEAELGRRRSGIARELDSSLQLEEDENRRRERRERLRLKRSGMSPRTKLATTTSDPIRAVNKSASSSPRHNASWGRRGGDHEEEASASSSSTSDLGPQSTAQEGCLSPPFPGRQGLLKKVLNLKHRRRSV